MTTIELDAEDIRQLWSLACLLAQHQLLNQTVKCLEPLCAIDCITRSTQEQAVLVKANVLCAEMIGIACSNSRKEDDCELWTRRVIKMEQCINCSDSAISRGVFCSQDNKLRIVKAKFLLQQQLKVQRSVKTKRLLEILTEGIKLCAEVKSNDVVQFQQYFEVKLKACLVKMHATTTLAKYSKDNKGADTFMDNLLYIRTTLSNYVDKRFLLWLVEATCHSAISSFNPGETAEMNRLAGFGEEFFDRVSQQERVSTSFCLHHLISIGFYYLRTGNVSKVTRILEQVKILAYNDTRNSDQEPGESVTRTCLHTILDSMRVSVVACSNPKEACDLAKTTILAAQTSLRTCDQFPAVRIMLIATLFDMLHVYCRLLSLQCQYADMGASIVQMTTLFATYRADLERTVCYRFFLAHCHTLIAKYAAAIGKIKDACAHLNYVVDRLLPVPSVDETSYPDAYLAVWIDVLEVATYCCGIDGTEVVSTSSSDPISLQIKQIYPSRYLLEWVARIFVFDGLQHQIHKCCNIELRAKYNLALAKWIWAMRSSLDVVITNDSKIVRPTAPFTQHAALEDLRPKSLTLLREALQHMNTTRLSCCEVTSEVMALFGPQLIAVGEVEQGESMLKNAIRIAVHSKNVLLQTRLLADVLKRYTSKGLAVTQVTAALKYKKKLAVLHRRLAIAQGNSDTIAALLRWTASSIDKKQDVKTTL